MRLYTHPACLDHRPGPGNPEAPARLQAVVDAISTQWPEERWNHPRAATRAEVMRVHRADLVALVLDSRFQDAHDTLHIDAETVLSPGSADAALHAAGAGIEAVDAVMAGPARRAFCAVRPPGHHATAAQAMGFCLFNNIAVAAEHAIEVHGLARVAIVDFDVHHGNGSEAIFASDARVLYLSTHQSPLFPGTGAAGDVGIGNVLNRPLAPQTGSGAFRGMWSGDLLPALNAFRPQLVLVSAGFDGHRRDPLADLQLDADDFAWLTRELAAVADRHAEGRLVSMLEGGYDLQALRECVLVHVDVLLHA
ncbi:histone deacetylase family protein [Lysobacter ciconiae]|uniref:Histone deacetylase family protein n=1 Tax=Novilysobacter ciconiae TaxID=2781022 RepID=A0A7S6ZTG5_9GAMM|nr:histone deacetylase family protein [Lysobacter ciconiae]QOW20912.1 histone deacetylase family protein [Lysobacter ciconiae]